MQILGEFAIFVKCQCIFDLIFTIISPWKNFSRKVWSFILKNLNPFNKECLVPSLVKIGPVVLDKKMKSVKSSQTDGQCTQDIQKISSVGLKHDSALSVGSQPIVWCYGIYIVSGSNPTV